MYENWKKSNKRMIIMAVLMLLIGAIMFIFISFNLLGFGDSLSKGSGIKPDDMKLYGEFFCIFTVILALAIIWRKMKENPEKVLVKSLKRYANTMQDPDAVLERLKKTWETGEQLRYWCHMDDEYIIDCMNGPCYANVIPVKEVVWAYKTVTRTGAVIKTNSTLFVHYANHKSGSISISENTIDYILQQFTEKNRDIAVGHNSQVEKLYFNKDMAGLREYAHQQRIGIS